MLPEQLPQVLAGAIRVAIGKRGVAVVVIPGDVALKPPDATIPLWLMPATPMTRPADEDIRDLAAFLNAGKRITLFCGRAAPAPMTR